MRNFILGLICCVGGLLFCACETGVPYMNTPPGLNRPLSGEYIDMMFGDESWVAIGDNLGSCYAKFDSVNPLWYDVVICTEDVNDFSIEHYRKHLFIHIDTDSSNNVRDFRIIYYKNKNTERSGDYELNLESLDGTMHITVNDGRLSGAFDGRMRNTGRSSDIRRSTIIFQDVPLSSIR